MRAPQFVLASLFAVACGPTASPDVVDAGGQPIPDAGTEPTVPLSGFGTISGDCGVLDDELLSADDFVFRNHLDFGADPFDAEDAERLTEGGVRLYETPNAGGSSALSEVFSYEVLERCERATLVKTETEVGYSEPHSKLTDLLVGIDGHRVGVSVTRAVAWPRDAEYTVEAAATLLTKKLEGILESSRNVVEEDRWVKQILHVMAYADGHADAMEAAWSELDDALRADTILIVTVSDGADEFIYSN